MLGSMGGGGGAQATAALGVMGMGGDKGCMPNLTYRQVPNKEHRTRRGTAADLPRTRACGINHRPGLASDESHCVGVYAPR